MSQKSAPQRPVQPRVSGGIPWWLWLLLFIVGGGTALALFRKSIPDDPEQLYRTALTAVDKKDSEMLRENFDKLKQFPEYGRQQKLLEGITLLGVSRPLKAIPLLKEAAGEENDANKELRLTALRFLGGAYAVAADRPMAIRTFEKMLAEDPNSDIARQNIVSILTGILAWEESLSHLNILADKKFNLSQVLSMRGDIRTELKQFREAADDFEAAINADEADPLNSSKVNKLVQCLLQIQDFEKAGSFIDQLDHPSKKTIARAEILLAKNDLKGALSSLDALRREAPNAPDSALVYGRIMVKYNTPERAAEGLVTLRAAVVTSSRDVELYRTMVQLAQVAGETELAGLAQQNVELLDSMHAEFDQKLAEVIRTRDDAESRSQLAELAYQCGRVQLAYKIYQGLAEYYPDRASEFNAKTEQLLSSLPQLVSTATGAGVESSESAPPASDATSPQDAN
jgi:tetratricopeptide (TPR) repeat protein